MDENNPKQGQFKAEGAAKITWSNEGVMFEMPEETSPEDFCNALFNLMLHNEKVATAVVNCYNNAKIMLDEGGNRVEVYGLMHCLAAKREELIGQRYEQVMKVAGSDQIVN